MTINHADRLTLADRIRAHIGTIASKCSLPVGEWNNIAEDFYEAADQLELSTKYVALAEQRRGGLTEIDTIAVCVGVVEPQSYRGMLENIARIARAALAPASANEVKHD